jgi:hypothetical protein
VVDDASEPDSRDRREALRANLGRAYYEQLWNWVTTHPDIRILHTGAVSQYSLAEFEKAECPDNSRLEVTNSDHAPYPPSSTQRILPTGSLLALRSHLRERLSTERHRPKSSKDVIQSDPSTTSLDAGSVVDKSSMAVQNTAVPRQPRALPENNDIIAAVFDDPTSDTSKPRLYASQSRIWQALTGHSMDLKKVPTMEFALLSIIAASGTKGIPQPDLTHLSGQDKRSVPHRTDELARKGYIVKRPVQAGKMRTSLCIHTKFVSQDHYTSSAAVEDVFQVGTFVASGFMKLIYEKFKDAGVVPTRDIRTRLVNIPISLQSYH